MLIFKGEIPKNPYTFKERIETNHEAFINLLWAEFAAGQQSILNKCVEVDIDVILDYWLECKSQYETEGKHIVSFSQFIQESKE